MRGAFVVVVSVGLMSTGCLHESSGVAGPLSLVEIHSEDGTARTSLGECIGFTVVASEPITFADDVQVSLGPLDVVPVTRLDATHLRVGAEETGLTCVYLPLFAEAGAWALTITSRGETHVMESALIVDPLVPYDIGHVAKERVWSGDVLDAPGANVLERAYDVDVYAADFSTAYHVYDHADFFGTGEGRGYVPVLELWSEQHPESYLGRGGLSVIFPQGGRQLVVVRDAEGAGAPELTYEVGFVGDELGSTANADDCLGNIPRITPRGYHVNYDDLKDDFDPQGGDGCRDSIYGGPVRGPGNDAVWRVVIPAHKELRVSTYDDHIDNVTYLLPLPAAGVACPRVPPSCIAASGRFGGGNTDTLVHRNDTDEDVELLLVHDSATVMSEEVGTFLINVGIFER